MGRRAEENCQPGFNLVVIDVDGGTSRKTVELLLSDYKYLTYATKRSTPENNRFRVILPLSHVVKLNACGFKQFMNNIYNWLPFDADTATGQRARKWLTNPGEYKYNLAGEPIDAFLFIPDTKKSIEHTESITTMTNMSNVERWFVGNTSVGNRSNKLIRYAYMLVDTGCPIESIRDKVLALNSKLPEPLQETEVLSTVLVSVTKKINQRNGV